jgi:hypothetical protein
MLRLQYALTTWFNGVQESKALALVLVLLSKEHSAMQLLVLVAAKANTNFSIEIKKPGFFPGFFYD